MPSTKQFGTRIDILDDCLRRRDLKWTANSLLEEVNRRLHNSHGKKISIRTLYGDIEHLVHELDAPVEKWRDGQSICFRYANDDYSIHNVPVRQEDVQRLREVTDIITQVSGPHLAEEVSALVNRLESTVFSNVLGRGAIIQFENNGKTAGSAWLTDVFDAIRDKTALTVEYEPFGKKRTESVFHPYLLKEYRNRWFLIGRVAESDDPTVLPLDRVVGVRPSSRRFVENDIFDPEEYMTHLIGVTWPPDAQPETVRLRVHRDHYDSISNHPIHESQRHLGNDDEGCHILELTVLNNPELRSILMSHGPGLVVEGPPALRRQIAQMYQSGAGAYRTM